MAKVDTSKKRKKLGTKLLKALTLSTCLSGCISGPKNSDQKFSEKLRADSYDSSNTVMGVPVLTRKLLSRKIAGKILCGEGLSQRPANQATVTLIDNDKVIASASTDVNGVYNIVASISAEKTYKLQSSAKCGISTKEISLKENSNYDLILKN